MQAMAATKIPNSKFQIPEHAQTLTLVNLESILQALSIPPFHLLNMQDTYFSNLKKFSHALGFRAEFISPFIIPNPKWLFRKGLVRRFFICTAFFCARTQNHLFIFRKC